MKVVLSIAGLDPSGGAGVFADIKTIAAHHLYAESVATALTVQNTTGVLGVIEVEPSFVARQMEAVFQDIRPDAVKVGMVASAAMVNTLADVITRFGADNVVVDPVMASTSGASLASGEAYDALVEWLFPLARVVTPNIPEAEVLSGMPIVCKRDVERAADTIARRCAVADGTLPAILVKGGHAAGASDDCLRMPDGAFVWLCGERIDSANSHGTGCTLSSAIACGLAQGRPVEDAVGEAKAYVVGALRAGLDLGAGNGPLDHMWHMEGMEQSAVKGDGA